MTRTHLRPVLLVLGVSVATLLLPIATLLLPVATLLVSGGAAAQAVDGPLVVKIHADWCGTCRAMAPSWDRAERALGEEARFVVLDVTAADQLAESRRRASALGITGFFDAYKAKTGTVGVLAPDGTPIATFKGELTLEDLRAALTQAGPQA